VHSSWESSLKAVRSDASWEVHMVHGLVGVRNGMVMVVCVLLCVVVVWYC